jgi:hypothetical protein
MTEPWIFPENPCYQCGHESVEHDSDGCMNGGKFGPMGAYEPGPDACECIAFMTSEPTKEGR